MDQTQSNPSAPKNRVPLPVQCAGWLMVALVVFSLGFWPLRVSHDEWWHLKTGKWIVDNNYRLPEKDVFTYTAANYDWDNHEWLSEAGMYLIYRWGEEWTLGGWRALILAKALILVATYLLLGRFMYQRAGGGWRGFLIAVFLAILAAAVGRKTFWPRPPVISYFFMVFFLYVLWLHRSGRLSARWLLVLPFLMPLWANLHGGFIIGGLIVASYFGGELAEWGWMKWIARKPGEELAAKRRRVLIYLGIGFLCGLGSLMTPYGYKLYLLTQRVMSSKDLVWRLSELRPPDFHFTWAYAFLLALLGVGLLLLLVRTLARQHPKWPPIADLLITAFFFHQSINHVRHLPWFGIVGCALAAWMLREWWENAGLLFRKIIGAGLAAGFLVCAAWLVFLPGEAIGVMRHLQNPGRVPLAPSSLNYNLRLLQGEEVVRGEYPEQAVNFILSAKLPGRMFNRNHLAGYLIWRLSPEHYKVFTDSRFDIFGEDFLMDEISIDRGAEGEGLRISPYGTPIRDWRAVVERWHINWMFLERSAETNQVLSKPGSSWALIYMDHGYTIWIKRTPANQPWIEKYEIPVGRE